MSTEHDPLSPVFEWRLKAALDRVTPPASLPRYASASMGRARPWRVAPFLLAAAMVVLLALTATATTGSPNPVVWTQDAASTIQSVGHPTGSIPSPAAVPEQAPANPSRSAPAAPAPAATHQPQHAASPTPDRAEQPEDSPRPEPTDSSNQWDGHWGSGNTTQSSGSPRQSHGRHDSQ
jgi:hypothetical protein